MITTKCPVCGNPIESPTEPEEGNVLICSFCKFCIDKVMNDKSLWIRFKK